MLCTFYGGYCSLWPNRTARSLSRAWPSLLRAHNLIGGATAVPLHRKKCLLCSVLIYIVLVHTATTVNRFPCKECGKVFDKAGYLAQHMKMHAQPQYKCPTCERRFIWRAGRNRHAIICATGVAYPTVTQPNPGAL